MLQNNLVIYDLDEHDYYLLKKEKKVHLNSCYTCI